jgi:hypothetical protein
MGDRIFADAATVFVFDVILSECTESKAAAQQRTCGCRWFF